MQSTEKSGHSNTHGIMKAAPTRYLFEQSSCDPCSCRICAVDEENLHMKGVIGYN